MPEVMAEVGQFGAAAQGMWGKILGGGKLKSDQHGLTLTRTRTLNPNLTLTRTRHPHPNPNRNQV